MELRNLHGGTDGRMSPAPGSALPYPADVAQVLSYLANLIDRSIDVRGVGVEVRHFAAGFLGVPLTELVATTEQLRTMAFQLAALSFADQLAAFPPAAVIGDDTETPRPGRRWIWARSACRSRTRSPPHSPPAARPPAPSSCSSTTNTRRGSSR
jgi:hypothetical protein